MAGVNYPGDYALSKMYTSALMEQVMKSINRECITWLNGLVQMRLISSGYEIYLLQHLVERLSEVLRFELVVIYFLSPLKGEIF